jgi:signal transduction histidine kinase
MFHQQFKRELLQDETASSMSSTLDSVDSTEWNLFNLGLALLNSDLQLLSWNQALPSMLDGERELLPNTYVVNALDMTILEGHAIKAVLAQNASWTSKRKVGQRSLRLEITHILPSSESSSEEAPTAAYTLSVLDYSAESRETQALLEAKNMAERSDRAKSQFLSHMSHELRTPLNAILGFSQLLSIDESLNAEQQDSIKEVENAGHYLLTLINEILDLARIDAGRIELQQEQVLLEPLLHECFALVKPLAAAKGLTLNYSLDPTLSLQSDHVRLKQVLLNLLSNAVKYNEVGGKVLLQCRQLPNVLRIEVIDSGFGIATEEQTCIFSPFERLGAERRHIEGTGIGLMITRRLVKLMNGEIGLVSDQGAGSIFWIELPNASTKSAAVLTGSEARALLVMAPPASSLCKLMSALRNIRPQWQIAFAEDPSACNDWLAGHATGTVLLSQDLQSMLPPASFTNETLKRNYHLAVISHHVSKFLDIPLFELQDFELYNFGL